MFNKLYLVALCSILICVNLNLRAQTYSIPSEDQQHEGTWLQWPHEFEYGITYRDDLDSTWVSMTQALVGGEKVHIVAYNNTEKARIMSLLSSSGVNLTNVDFKIFRTNDVWVRDNGPIFVRDINGNLFVEDWGFNGWGGKYNSILCDSIPTKIGASIGVPVVNLNTTMVVEGGAVEMDGKGVLIACKSSILSQTPANTVRNPGMSQATAESILAGKLGVSKFIWLDGVPGSDITDTHIDGFAKFANDSTLLTMNNADLISWGISSADISRLYSATSVSGHLYNKVYVPLTLNNVFTTYGTDLGNKGSYCNYYIANNVILVPNYEDPNDNIANAIIQALHPGRTVVGIDVRNLYAEGGMVHCVTQQQPFPHTAGINDVNGQHSDFVFELIFPNPVKDITTFSLTLPEDAVVQIEIFNSNGQLVKTIMNKQLLAGKHELVFSVTDIPNGIYYCVAKVNSQYTTRKMSVLK